MTAELTEQAMPIADQVDMLVENRLADLQLALDDVGWKPLGSDSIEDQQELALDTIKSTADMARSLAVINPLIKHGIGVRTQYIWNKGIRFKGIEETDKVLENPLNKKYLFSSEAQIEMEKCLATDGNFFFLARGKAGRRRAGGAGEATGQRIPFSQIVGIVTNPDDSEDVWFYRRKWSVTKWLKTVDREVKEEREEYYPSDLYDTRNGKPNSIRGKKVNWDSVLIEHSVNKQVGWRYGLPDVMPVIFWAKAHKEFLEDSAKLIKAYSRYAFKATAPTPAGVKNMATKVAAQPQRGPYGDKADIGGTAVMTAGANLQPLGRTAGSVDFNAGTPLAGYVAAGLEIPLTDLLSDSSLSNRSAAETLSESKLAAMQQRQKSWGLFFERLFAFWGKSVEAWFEPIESDPTYRQVQSVMLAAASHVLSAEEVRELLVAAFHLNTDADLPTEEELGLLILEQVKAEEQQAQAVEQQQNAAEQKAAEQNSPSYGDNTNRSEIGQHAYTHNQDQ